MLKTIYDKFPCPTCGNYTNRGLSVDIVIVKNNKILLGKRGADPEKGKWVLFGGYIDWNESPEQALERELKEETNLKLVTKQFIGVYGDPKRHPYQVITHAFGVQAEGEPHHGDDIQELKWFQLSDLPSPLAFDHSKIINDYLKMIQNDE